MIADPFEEARGEDMTLALAEERHRERNIEDQLEDQFIALQVERALEEQFFAAQEDAPASPTFDSNDLPF